jgi:putative endonuclease
MQNSPSNIRWSAGIDWVSRPIRTLYRELLDLSREILLQVGRGDVGRWGEQKALNYVRSQGIDPIESNWRSGQYEGDILALDGRILVIVEVKTRHKKHQSAFPAIDAVNHEKHASLQKLTRRYQRRKAPMLRRLCIRTTRIDVIEVYYETNRLWGHSVAEILYHHGSISSLLSL